MYVSQKVLDAMQDAFEAFEMSVGSGNERYSDSYDILLNFASKAKAENSKRKRRQMTKKNLKTK